MRSFSFFMNHFSIRPLQEEKPNAEHADKTEKPQEEIPVEAALISAHLLKNSSASLHHAIVILPDGDIACGYHNKINETKGIAFFNSKTLKEKSLIPYNDIQHLQLAVLSSGNLASLNYDIELKQILLCHWDTKTYKLLAKQALTITSAPDEAISSLAMLALPDNRLACHITPEKTVLIYAFNHSTHEIKLESGIDYMKPLLAFHHSDFDNFFASLLKSKNQLLLKLTPSSLSSYPIAINLTKQKYLYAEDCSKPIHDLTTLDDGIFVSIEYLQIDPSHCQTVIRLLQIENETDNVIVLGMFDHLRTSHKLDKIFCLDDQTILFADDTNKLYSWDPAHPQSSPRLLPLDEHMGQIQYIELFQTHLLIQHQNSSGVKNAILKDICQLIKAPVNTPLKPLEVIALTTEQTESKTASPTI